MKLNIVRFSDLSTDLKILVVSCWVIVVLFMFGFIVGFTKVLW